MAKVFRWLFAALTLLPLALPAQSATLFYLHGKIVEDQGDLAMHPQYGRYHYADIVAALGKPGHQVHSEIRAPATNPRAYAKVVVAAIEQQMQQGTPANQIVILGFSKGAQIAVLVSNMLHNADIRYVIQAVCGSWIRNRPRLTLSGRVLSMYERSDGAGSCQSLFERNRLQADEIALNTGLAHGLFYQPRPSWVTPLLDWIAQTDP